MLIAIGLPSTLSSGTERHRSVWAEFTNLDAKAGLVGDRDPSAVERSRQLEDGAGRCATTAPEQRLECIAALVTGTLVPSDKPDDLRASTVTGALVAGAGDCVALTAVGLVTADLAGTPASARVFDDHVVLCDDGGATCFELLERGRKLRPEELTNRSASCEFPLETVGMSRFLAHYADNLAARTAAAGRVAEGLALVAGFRGERRHSARLSYNYGTLLLRAGRELDARPELKRACRLAPRAATAWANLGWAEIRLGHSREGRDAFTKALELDPRNPFALAGLQEVESGIAVAPD